MRCPTLADLPLPPEGRTGWPWTTASSQLPDQMENGRPWPKLSIVTPSYNQGQYLEETIRSVLLQGYPNLEYIIMDGGSADQSPQIIRKYARWLSHFAIKKDRGQADAINGGLNRAEGDWLCFINSDDVYESGALANTIVYLVRSGCDPTKLVLAAGHVTDYRAGSPAVVAQNREFGSIAHWVAGGVSIHQPGTLWSRTLWKLAGPFPTSHDFTFDRFFFARARALNAEYVHLDFKIARFRIHDESKTVRDAQLFDDDWQNGLSNLIATFPPSAQREAINALFTKRVASELSDVLTIQPRQQRLRRLWQFALENPRVLFNRMYLGALRRSLIGV